MLNGRGNYWEEVVDENVDIRASVGSFFVKNSTNNGRKAIAKLEHGIWANADRKLEGAKEKGVPARCFVKGVNENGSSRIK